MAALRGGGTGCGALSQGPAAHLMGGGREDAEPWKADKTPHMAIRTVPNTLLGPDTWQWRAEELCTRVVPPPASHKWPVPKHQAAI